MKEDESLKNHLDRTIIYNPIIVIDKVDGKIVHRIHITELDPMGNDPTGFGILLSDLVDTTSREAITTLLVEIHAIFVRVSSR